ncbi:unnamed protein product [Pieris brassicae]|uniref:Lactase-phlorizin hydrolase n=1 Tax=Pieris brassicae TaxID=7116 RepID=A0A9P0TGH2_PIEBR|nr:unnamed protein product [Pieris brassicae]
MCCLKVIVFSALIAVVCGERRFPVAFKFGAATASYQVEGAWNVSDKSASIWDTFIHNNASAIVDQSNGDVACDSYHKWREDLNLASELGLDFYRSVSDIAVSGWANPLIVEWFADYARVAYDLFGDRIQSWITINEGMIACEATYSMGSFAPGIYSPGLGSYLCNKNVLLAHAKAWRLYDEEYKSKYGGKVSLTNQIMWAQAYSEEYEDLAELVLQMSAGLYSHAIYSKEGGWPPSVEKYIAEKSAREGYTRSRLPPFTDEEIDLIKGTFDFYAFNYYTGRLVRNPKEGEKIGKWPFYGCIEINALMEPAPEWPPTSSKRFFEYPEGLRRLLSWLKKNYGDVEYRIMENGYASDKRDINDIDRVNYYKTHLEQVYLAITEDNVNVTYYTAWTLLDNFEWVDGYVSKFGLIDVDFTKPDRPRTPRSSAYYYANVISTRSCALIAVVRGERRFPDAFKFGAATASYQVEGAWNVSDKSASVWDTYSHNNPSAIVDHSNGDVACDSYHKWREDLNLASEMGLDFYSCGKKKLRNMAMYRPVFTVTEFPRWSSKKKGPMIPCAEIAAFGECKGFCYLKRGLSEAGLYSHPIYSKEGGWPPSIEKHIAEKSRREGYTRSRLPPFTNEEIDLIKGTFDFYALNYYTSRLVRSPKEGEKIGEWPLLGCEEINALMEPAPEWPPTSSKWLFEYPEGLRRLLSWLKQNYGDVEYRIMENGYASDKRDLNDVDRVNYYKTHLEQVYLAITEDNVNVTCYTAWTLLDNFEWTNGYVSKFGLIDVDFTKPDRPRTPRSSAYYYANVISTRSCALIAVVRGERRFPDAFKFGAATASYQVEGAWNVSDKSASVWDTYSHNNPSAITDHSNGDVACDSYHKWREDLNLASELGLDFYRYDPKLSHRIHFPGYDLEFPRFYIDSGVLCNMHASPRGWANPLIVEWFADYARVAYDLFGDRIKSWITINEGLVTCEAAAGVYSTGFGSYLCNKNVLLAHAKAWRLYDEQYKPKYGGKVSMTTIIMWVQAHSEEYEDLAELVLQMSAGLYSHAIYSKEGGWPPSVEKYIAEKSAREGYTRSRLPPFTDEEIDLIKGTFDFYALNYYTSRLVRSPKEGEKIGDWPLYGCEEINALMEPAPEWPPTSSKWLFEYPEGLRRLLSWLKKNYGDVEYRIMENGYASDKRDLNDVDRVHYYKTHLEQVYLAITEDNVNVTCYTAWTLLDNFEWGNGYVSKFGLIDVDFTKPDRPRTPRSSAYYYANVISTRSLPDDDLKTNPEP